MSAAVLNFPAAVTCQSCGRPCGEDELSECYACGDKFCGSARTNCKSICSCDRLAGYLADVLAVGISAAMRSLRLKEYR
jgi:hypothetical protein